MQTPPKASGLRNSDESPHSTNQGRRVAVAPRKACFYYDDQQSGQHTESNEFYDTTNYQKHLDNMMNV